MNVNSRPGESHAKFYLAKGGRDSEFIPPRGGTLLDLDAAENSGSAVTAGGAGSSTASHGTSGSGNMKDEDVHATEQIHQIIVPSYSAWFDYNS